MVEITRLEPHHAEQLLAQDSMASLRPFATPEILANMAEREYSFSAFAENGKLVACGGISEYWHNRGEAWMLFDDSCRRDFLSVHNVVKKFLDSCPIKRIEAAVDVNFKAGHRWVQLLGFELEAPVMKSYRHDGVDCALYALVKEHNNGS